MRVIHRYANLRAISLTQYRRKKQRMLFYFAVLEHTPLDQPVLKLFNVEFSQVIDGAARRALDFESIGDQFLMENMQMSRVDGIFHRLQPIAVELRQSAQPVPAVGARPDIVLGYFRRGQRPHVGPVKAGKFSHRIGLLFDSETKFTVSRLRGRLKAVAFDIIEPAVIGAGETALFGATIGERNAAM